MKIFRRKFMKKVKKRIPWVEHLITDVKIAGDLNPQSDVEVEAREGSLCLICRGSKMLCGKPRCPAILKFYSFLKVKKKIDTTHISGSSPPGVFVGRIGYPYVYAGPLVPPILGDTSLLDTPEEWVGKTIDEIVDFRTNLVRSKIRVNVKKPYKAGKPIEQTLELALSRDSVDTFVAFKRKPSGRFFLDGEVQPMGPSALLRTMEVENVKTDSRIEKVYSDTDLKAEEALLNLYLNRVPVSRIQRSFSIGAFGVKKRRKIVPTRWSITAVDSVISRRLIEDQIKGKNVINEYRVHEFNYLGNKFLILLIPSSWSYEWIEAWYPGTTWNIESQTIAMGGDWESYKGRTTYASIGGCYYAVRLASAEYLANIGKQASVVAMREIYPGFVTPLGVWINRESVREALRSDGEKFDTLKEALDYINSRFTIRLKEWIDASVVLKNALYQEKLTKYLRNDKVRR